MDDVVGPDALFRAAFTRKGDGPRSASSARRRTLGTPSTEDVEVGPYSQRVSVAQPTMRMGGFSGRGGLEPGAEGMAEGAGFGTASPSRAASATKRRSMP